MRDREFIEQTIGELCSGWYDKIEYGVKVGDDTEKRAKRVRHPALLAQLARVSTGGAATGDKCERTAPNKPASRPPGDMRGVELLDQIHQESLYCYNLILAHEGREPMIVSTGTVAILRNIVAGLESVEHQPKITREIAGCALRWRTTARTILGYEKPLKMLDSVTCGDCGGALGVTDGETITVWCVGTPHAAPCGKTYPQNSWLGLLERPC